MYVECHTPYKIILTSRSIITMDDAILYKCCNNTHVIKKTSLEAFMVHSCMYQVHVAGMKTVVHCPVEVGEQKVSVECQTLPVS